MIADATNKELIAELSDRLELRTRKTGDVDGELLTAEELLNKIHGHLADTEEGSDAGVLDEAINDVVSWIHEWRKNAK